MFEWDYQLNFARQKIYMIGNEMVFTKHFTKKFRLIDCHQLSFNKTYLIFEDHYKGD